MEPTDEMVDAALREWSKPNDRREGRDIMRAAISAALAVSPKPRVRKLEWEEVTTARIAEDPTLEPTGDYEALSPVGIYYVQMYFGTDSYGWNVMLDYNDVADKDDPEDAKAAAQADYERRVLSALEDQS
jgi:hypothetical protein